MKLLRSELNSEFNNRLFDISAEDFPDRGTVFADNHITCELSARNIDFGFKIFGVIKAIPEYECVRCLCTIPRNQILPIKLWLIHDKEKSNIENDIVLFPKDDDEIDLNSSIADIISLAEPMSPLCHELCKGLCSQCGKNMNQVSCDCELDMSNNPWGALNKLKLK